jgi:aminoglycoside phosphotransferase (APT) family kinase protein
MNSDHANSLDIEDHAALAAYLRESQRVPTDGLTFETLAGGVSNKTVRVNFPDDHGWVIKQALAKLRTKADWFSDPARVHREALGIRWLNKLAPTGCVPDFVFEDFDHHLLAMQAVPLPHKNWKTMLLDGDVRESQAQQFGMLLGAIHRGAAQSEEPLKDIFADRSFFESLRLEPYYEYAATQVPAAADFIRDLVRDTRQRNMTLVHGDYSPKNILVHHSKVILLDHEVIHWGDPAFDVGFALTHFLSKAHHMRSPEMIHLAREFIGCYRGVVKRDHWEANVQAMAVRHTLGCMLARVAGRSPLEYLSERECVDQQNATVALMQQPPSTIEELMTGFIAFGIGPNAKD